MIGRSNKRLIPKGSSTSKSVVKDLTTNPSEKSITVQSEIARDPNEEASNSKCESHVKNETSESHVEGDKESINLSQDEHVDCEGVSSSFKDPSTSLPPIRIPTPQLKHLFSFDSLDSLSEEICDEDFPDEFFTFPGYCGNIGLVLGPEDWEKIETHDSSEENLNTGDCGTNSTRFVSGYGRDEGWDVDSKASSNSPRQNQDPKERVSSLSCGTEKDLLTMATSAGCDELIEKSGAEINWSDQLSLESDYNTSFNDMSTEVYEESFVLHKGLYSTKMTMNNNRNPEILRLKDM